MKTVLFKVYGCVIRAVQIVGGLFYSCLKCLPTQNKVLFLSRQSNVPSLDFRLMQKELARRDPDVRVVMISKKLEKTLGSVIRYAWYSLLSMYHLATSRVCLLESYWPTVSMFEHKPELTVIQMWHALGKVKQSGYQTLDRTYGRQGELARLLCMHKGYDVVVAGNRSMNAYYCQSFGVEESKLLNIGLPRLDYLVEESDHNRQCLLERFPQYQDKTVVLYAPTFRRNTVVDYSPILNKLSDAGYAVIVKPHPNQELKDPEMIKHHTCPGMTTMQVIGACDVVITDFSAISFEAAALNKRLYFYLFDRQEYLEKNGVNIDMSREMPQCVYQDLDQLIWDIQNTAYDWGDLARFQDNYLPNPLTGATEKLGQLIIDCIRDDKHEAIHKNLVYKAKAPVYLD